MGIWLTPVLIVGIHGDFPLNDDWAYALATRHFLDTGEIQRTNWTYIPLFTNIALGSVAGLFSEFSFEVLRATTLVLGFAGVLSTYALSRVIGLSVIPSTILAMIVALNPIYLNLSYTFMTDVPFTALTVASLALFAHGTKTGAVTSTGGAFLLALAATLSRQPGLAIFVAFGVVTVAYINYKFGRRIAAIFVVIAGVVLIVSLKFAKTWFFGADYYFLNAFVNPYLADRLFRNGLTTFVYLGLFLTPVLILALERGVRFSRALALGSFLPVIPALAALELWDLQMPLGINIVQGYGLGPQSLFVSNDGPIDIPKEFWVGVTTIGLWGGFFSAGMILSGLWRQRIFAQRRLEIILLTAFVLVYTLPLLTRAPFFDRYLLPVVGPLGALVLLLTPHGTRRGFYVRGVSVILMFLLSTWSVVGTRDYLEHHRARWNLLVPLMEQGVPPSRVDGGFEFTGWFNSTPNFNNYRGDSDRGHRWFEDDIYILSYSSSIDAYDPVASVSYTRWLTARSETLTLHRRQL